MNLHTTKFLTRPFTPMCIFFLITIFLCGLPRNAMAGYNQVAKNFSPTLPTCASENAINYMYEWIGNFNGYCDCVHFGAELYGLTLEETTVGSTTTRHGFAQVIRDLTWKEPCEITPAVDYYSCSQSHNNTLSPQFSSISGGFCTEDYLGQFFYQILDWNETQLGYWLQTGAVVTEQFAGPGWTVDYIHPASYPLDPYDVQAICECADPLWDTRRSTGHSAVYKLIIHLDPGACLPSLGSLGIPTYLPPGTGGDENRLPTVAITCPANGTIYRDPADIVIKATASDPDGSVSSVQFFQNGTSLGTDSTAPSYSWDWNDVESGTYVLTAKVTDNLGAVSYSAPITVHVVVAGPIHNPDNGHIYYLVGPTDWVNAEAQATKLGGHLVTIDDEEENEWVLNTFGEYGATLWIGLNDFAEEDTWQWFDGTTVDY